MPSLSRRIDWQGQPRSIEIVQLDGPQLLGMEMLRGSQLRMMVEDDGLIEITPFGQL